MLATDMSWPDAVVTCVIVICVVAFGAYALHLQWHSPAERPRASGFLWRYKRTTTRGTTDDDEHRRSTD